MAFQDTAVGLGQKAGNAAGNNKNAILQALAQMAGIGENAAGAVPGANPVAEASMKITKQVAKGLGDFYTQHAVQAAQAGMPGGAILDQLNQMVGGSVAMASQQPQQNPQQAAQPGQAPAPAPPVNHQPLVQAAVGGQVQQPPTSVAPTTTQYNPQVLPANGPFSGPELLPGGGVRQQGFFGSLFGPSATDLLNQQGKAIANSQGMQKLQGSEPLQAGEKEKLMMERETKYGEAGITSGAAGVKMDTERRDKFFEALDKPMAKESTLTIGQNSAAKDALDQFESILKTNPSAIRTPNWVGSPFGQKIKALGEQLDQALLRKESGAALTKDDRKFIKGLTVKTGFSALKEDPTTALFKIANLRKRIGVEGELLDPQSNLRTEIKKLEAAGFSRNDVWEFMKTKGRV